MNSYDFYKSLFDRELKRRNQIDRGINLPLTLLTVIIAINSYSLKHLELSSVCELISFNGLFILVIGIMYTVSMFILIKSYNNLFKGFDYANLAKPSEIRNFETIEIDKFNQNELIKESEKIDFENELIKQLNKATDKNILINDDRSLNLYFSKTFSILTIILSGLNSLVIIITNI